MVLQVLWRVRYEKINKEKIIIIATVVIALAVAIPVSLKNIRSYVAYVDSFGSDTMQDAVERTVKAYWRKDELMAENPRKALEYEYGKKWWENEDSFSYEGKLYDREIIKYGSEYEFRNIQITDEQEYSGLSLNYDFYNAQQAGLEPENISEINVRYEQRCRHTYDEDTYKSMSAFERELFTPMGVWSEWKWLESGPYIVYTVNGRWYCMYTGD